MIGAQRRDRLHAYIWPNCEGNGWCATSIGGMHLLVGLRSSHRLDYFLRDVKADSSQWIHHESGRRSFAWQKGYGAFSVSPSAIEGVKRYVLNQEEHHRQKTFQQEYIELLEPGGIEYEERYLW